MRFADFALPTDPGVRSPGSSDSKLIVSVGSLVGPVAVCPTFGDLEARLLRQLLDFVGVATSIGATTIALKEICAFWGAIDDPDSGDDWKSVRWVANLPESGLNAISAQGGRVLLMQGVLRCFAALFSHLLSLLACLSARVRACVRA